MNPEPQEIEILEQAVKRLEENTGLKTRIVWEPMPGVRTIVQKYRPDAQIVIDDGKKEFICWVEVKKQADRITNLLDAYNQLDTYGTGGIFVTRYLTNKLAEHCRKIGLLFLDTAGNAYLKKEGILVYIQGQKLDDAQDKREVPKRAFDRTGLRVVFALLADPKLLQAPYREIAKAAGVALGTVGWILTDLREQGLLYEDREGLRRWTDRERAVQAWITNYPLRLRPRLNPKRFRAAHDGWWKNADPVKFGGCWGGEIAATKLQGNLTPKTATIYIRGDRNPFLAAHRLRADDQGPIEVLDAFWDLPQAPEWARGLAHPMLVVADLQEIGDPRTYEEAKRIHDHDLA